MQNQQQFEDPEKMNLYASKTALTQEERESWETREALTLKRSEAARFEATLETARIEARNYRRVRWNRQAAKCIFLGVFVLMTLLGLSDLLAGRIGDATNLLVYIVLTTCFSGAAMSRTHKEAAEKLAQFDDVRAVGLLTEALESNDVALIVTARNALIRLLPRLQFSDADLLSIEQRNILNRALPSAVTREDRALSLATLKAYEQIGSENEAAAVKHLAESSVAAYDSELRQAAQDCLPSLHASIARRKESGQLLRASQAEDACPATLLRPASHSASPNDGRELLRSSQSEA